MHRKSPIFPDFERDIVPLNSAVSVECSPPSFHNFDHKIHMNDPYDFSAMVYDEEMDTYVQRDFIDKPTAPVVPEPSKV